MQSVFGTERTDLLLLAEEAALLGVEPRLTGVVGGRSLSNCSGLRTGPNETRLEFLLVSSFTTSTGFTTLTCSVLSW